MSSTSTSTSSTFSSISLTTVNNRGRDPAPAPHVSIPIASPDNIMLMVSSLQWRIDQSSPERTEWILRPQAGNKSCCIFKVPQFFVEANNKTYYHPSIVSIGPYHHGHHPGLELMQQHKWRFVGNLLARTPQNGPKLADYLQLVALQEDKIRRCYSETLHFAKNQLVEMMVLDAFFIIEILCGVASLPGTSPTQYLVDTDPDDSIKMGWVLPKLLQDFLLLENQIPFFVLQNLFDKSKPSRKESNLTFSEVALKFFNCAEVLQTSQSSVNNGEEASHLLDLVRLSFIPIPAVNSPKQNKAEPVQLIPSAKKLHQTGIKFKRRQMTTSFLDIRFCNGVLEIPQISVDDLLFDVFPNFVAFEQCYNHCRKYMTTYVTFMNCLIATPEDASFLCDMDIIERYVGNDAEVAHFFKSLGKHAAINIDQSYLAELLNDVNTYSKKIWNVQWTGLRLKYFDTPWSLISALAALILLLLTIFQAFFAAYAYFHPPTGN